MIEYATKSRSISAKRLLLQVGALENARKRKPLVLMGARQVGKTWLMEEFARKEFPGRHVIVNFMRMRALAQQIQSCDIDPAGLIRVLQAATGEEYVQHRVSSATGKFVGKVRADVESLMGKIASSCFEKDVFKTSLARRILSFAFEKWKDSPEFLWKNFPDYAVLRRKDTGKWYAVLMRVQGRKIGLETDDTLEIVDVRKDPAENDADLLPGYHMNKKSWATLVLDSGTGFGRVSSLLSSSREKAV